VIAWSCSTRLSRNAVSSSVWLCAETPSLRAAHVLATFTDVGAVAVLVTGPTTPFALRPFRLWLWHFGLSLNLPMPALVPRAAGFRTDNRESYDADGNSNGDAAAASRLRVVDRNNRQAHGDCQDDKRLCSLLEHQLTPPRAPISTRGRGRIGGEAADGSAFGLTSLWRYLSLSQYGSVHRFNFAAVARASKIRGRGLAAARQQSSAGGRTNRGIAPTSLSVSQAAARFFQWRALPRFEISCFSRSSR
jgi:hypothetical protein